MDKNIEQSIKARRDVVFTTYDIKDEKILKKIDELFGKINDLGKKCKDVSEFETKFAASPLNQEYMDLFTEIATRSVTSRMLFPQHMKQREKSKRFYSRLYFAKA